MQGLDCPRSGTLLQALLHVRTIPARTFRLRPAPQADIRVDLFLPKRLPPAVQRRFVAPRGARAGGCCQVFQLQMVEHFFQRAVRQRGPAIRAAALERKRPGRLRLLRRRCLGVRRTAACCISCTAIGVLLLVMVADGTVRSCS